MKASDPRPGKLSRELDPSEVPQYIDEGMPEARTVEWQSMDSSDDVVESAPEARAVGQQSLAAKPSAAGAEHRPGVEWDDETPASDSRAAYDDPPRSTSPDEGE